MAGRRTRSRLFTPLTYEGRASYAQGRLLRIKIVAVARLRNNAWFGQGEMPSIRDDHACLRALGVLWVKAQSQIPPRAEIIRIGVTLADLTPATERQLDLFLNDGLQRRRCEAITRAIDRLNQKFGKRLVTVGA
jgi:DNA polymerase IV